LFTDLAGVADFAALSTDALSRVERFAIFVTAEGCGSTVVTASPPLSAAGGLAPF
jgi:hypothetical protein